MRLISPRAYNGRWIVVPESRDRLARQAFKQEQRRRKLTLGVLVGVAALTGIWAIASGGSAIEIHLVADAGVAFYVALLLDAKRRRDERTSKVRRLQRPAPAEVSLYEAMEAGGRNS